MSRSIAIDEMAGAIEKELIEYRELAADELKTAVKLSVLNIKVKKLVHLVISDATVSIQLKT